ncbi:Nup85 nucleoporin-domain-containing protein [Epithele typhae]|uniref:Nup85 nucleoporin-domain-containing protein n=1 Tax=Epithele typhae TaxID=378194 RepID=UPI002008843E|nr:Nup85 nucleoporin-domain-containing protein [Epithele typhae]KAH9926312.1 Nup85 nucleoporin-domain-containing protein [Epithele typhae]
MGANCVLGNWRPVSGAAFPCDQHGGPKHSRHLVPPLFEHGAVEAFEQSGRTLSLAVSPRDESIAIYASPNTSRSQPTPRAPSEQVYLAGTHTPPRSERRVFVTDTLIIFAAVQNFMKDIRARKVELIQNEEAMGVMNKLGNDYVNFCKECCMHTSREPRTEPLQYEADHYRKLYTCFSAFVLLYLPEPSFEDVPIGDELMEWLNTHFIEPSTQEGDDLSSQARPWEDPNFWPYLTSSAFFLEVLANHPSTYLQPLTQQLSPLLTNHPRLNHFSAERDFAIASRRWRDKVKTLRLELDRVPESERDDGFENWWDRFSDIVSILEGRADVVRRVCAELGADWKEVCAAWGIFVDTRLRRQDLPEVVAQILDEVPPDPTDLEDVVYSALFLGKPAEALSTAEQLDIWLAAHLADLMEPIELIDSEPDFESDLTLRQHYLLTYAEYLQSDPGLWRITVDYMYSCGTIGAGMGDQMLVRVPLRLQAPPDAAAAGEEAAQIRSGQLAGVLKSVNEACFEYQREEVRRMVCRIAAQAFIREKEYGLAISYCTSAEDWPGLGRVVDLVLEEYIVQGTSCFLFAELVAHIAPSLQTLRLDGAGPGAPPPAFAHRLLFAVRFADFHRRRGAGDHAQLLPLGPDDACALMVRLEEAARGAPADYLAVLARVVGGSERHAAQRLQAVRLALARYYARCGAIDVGGRTAGWGY